MGTVTNCLSESCDCPSAKTDFSHTPAGMLSLSLEQLGFTAQVQNANTINIAEIIDNRVCKIAILVGKEDVVVTCQVDELTSIMSKNIRETDDPQNMLQMIENQRDFLFACVNANDIIAPFAISLITSEDDQSVDKDQSLVVLINRIPVEFFESKNAIQYHMKSLRKAIMYYNQSVRNFIR